MAALGAVSQTCLKAVHLSLVTVFAPRLSSLFDNRLRFFSLLLFGLFQIHISMLALSSSFSTSSFSPSLFHSRFRLKRNFRPYAYTYSIVFVDHWTVCGFFIFIAVVILFSLHQFSVLSPPPTDDRRSCFERR